MVLGPLMPVATHGHWSESGNQLGEKRKLPGPCCGGDLSGSGLTVCSGLNTAQLAQAQGVLTLSDLHDKLIFLVDDLGLQDLLKISQGFLFVEWCCWRHNSGPWSY